MKIVQIVRNNWQTTSIESIDCIVHFTYTILSNRHQETQQKPLKGEIQKNNKKRK